MAGITGLDGLNIPLDDNRMSKKEKTKSVQVRVSVQHRLQLYAVSHDEKAADLATKAIDLWLKKQEKKEKREV